LLTRPCEVHDLVEFIELRISWFLIAANVMGATVLRAMRA
jgi:hypothetical protein